MKLEDALYDHLNFHETMKEVYHRLEEWESLSEENDNLKEEVQFLKDKIEELENE